VTDVVGAISSASKEQTTGIEQVNMAVTQMDEVTQQNAALVEQASAAAQALAEQARSLRDVVAIFKLRGDGMGTMRAA
jgi:methyl-accepting chemotaxis protein-1 (serine sensor receptor)